MDEESNGKSMGVVSVKISYAKAGESCVFSRQELGGDWSWEESMSRSWTLLIPPYVEIMGQAV